MRPAVRAVARGADDRLGAAGFAKKSLRKLFPDHWSFLLGELALYSFVILLLTGTFLTLFFQPSMKDIVYHGSYTPLRGVHMSEAYASALRISFDVRGGLLMRQIHHWAALVFLGAIVAHLLRIFFTGAFRRPRELNWVIGATLFVLACAEGFCGYSLPDDLLSGTGLRTAEGIVLSIPVAGTYLSFFLFGGQYPGHEIVPRLYIVHVLLIPGLLIALITAHLMFIWHQEHTQWPGRKQREANDVGEPLYPIFMLKTGALFFFVFGVLAALAVAAQINPIWIYGPYTPAAASVGSQPDWYIGFAEGALRLMPGIATNVGGHTFAWNVFIPGALLPGLFFACLYVYPFFEQWATGDRRHHHVLDRPRNMPTRCGIGAAVMAAGIDLQLAAGDDIISQQFHISLFALVWLLRIGFFVFPLIVFGVARYACLALQQRDRHAVAHGFETGVVTPLPGGGFGAETKPVPAERIAVLAAQPPDSQIAWIPRHIFPLPTPRRVNAQIRARLNHFFTRYQQETPSAGPGGEQGRYEAALVRQERASPDGEHPEPTEDTEQPPGPGGEHPEPTKDTEQPEPPGPDGGQPELAKGREP